MDYPNNWHEYKITSNGKLLGIIIGYEWILLDMNGKLLDIIIGKLLECYSGPGERTHGYYGFF